MVRIFSIIAFLVTLLIVIAGLGMYWVSHSSSNQAQLEANKVLAKGIALSISSQTDVLQKIVIKIAKSADVIKVAESNNPQQIAQTETLMENYLPGVLKIRILPANINDLDEITTPRMGHADLLMSQAALVTQQKPILQGEGNNRHLAITSVIQKDSKAIGIVLASLKYDFIQANLNQYEMSHGYIELMQDKVLLASAGNVEGKSGQGDKIEVPKSAWQIYHWVVESSDIVAWSSMLGFILLPALLTGLICFLCYRKLARTLSEDHDSILKITKELMSQNNIGSHPVQLNEVKTIMTSLLQYKRDLDRVQTGQPIELKRHDDHLLNEPMDIEVLDTDIDDYIRDGNLIEQSNEQATAIAPPPLPVIDEKAAIFRAYDIRGIVGKALSEDMVFNIGRAVGSEAQEKNIQSIVVGMDGRTSSPSLLDSLSKGIISTGVNVLDIGLAPSPLVYFVAHHSEGKSAVVVTGSHNPTEYNGLKIIINGETYTDDKIQALKQRIDNDNYHTGTTGTISTNKLFTNEYIGTIDETIHFERSMKVVVDCGNGVAGELAPMLLKTLGCEVVELYCDIDGSFPNHHPDPSKPENLADLQSIVQDHKADLGIAFDGDGDRLGVVDCNGKIIWADRLMMFFAKDVLSLKPGAEIIYDIKCSRHLGEQIIKSGGRPLMQRTGHSYLKSKVKETGAALAGEMSGHFIFNKSWFGFDDALFAAAKLIEILSADTRNSAEVFADFPESISTPELTIELAEGENTHLMEKILENAKFDDGKIIEIDGMRVDFSDGWGLLRASNTMPVLTLRFEADTVEGMQRIQAQFKALLIKVKPSLDIPF